MNGWFHLCPSVSAGVLRRIRLAAAREGSPGRETKPSDDRKVQKLKALVFSFVVSKWPCFHLSPAAEVLTH